MDLSLAGILELSPLDRCRVVAGAEGMDRIVTSINIADSPDPGPWVSRGQLVLTTGYVFKDDPQEQVKLLRQLSRQGCAGLAIKFDRFFPEPPQQMVREADALRFPLIDIPYDMSLSDLMASVMKGILEYQHYRSRQEKAEAFFARLLDEELTGQEAILAEGRSLGLLPGRRYAVLCAAPEFPEGAAQDFLLTALEDAFLKGGQLAGVRVIPARTGAQMSALVQAPQPKPGPEAKSPWPSVARFVLEKAADFSSIPVSLGASGTKRSAAGLCAAYEEAQEALRIGQRISQPDSPKLYQYEELKPYTLLQALSGESCRQYVDSYLGVLLQFDQKNGAELIKTLRAYLAFNGRSADCAQQLFVHRNTINFRLSRIEELLGIDLKDGETIFRLQLALKLLDLKLDGGGLP